MYLQSHRTGLGKHTKAFLMIAIILVIFLSSTSLFRLPSQIIMNDFDDIYHSSIAYSISQGQGISTSTLPLPRQFQGTPEKLTSHGPLYHLSLGGLFTLLGTTPTSINFTASIFNSFLMSIFLVTFFLLCRKYFGINVAFVSTLLIAVSPSIVWYSTRGLLYPMVYLLVIASFIFLKNTKTNYILFGIFSGLASLTHPIGMLPFISYTTFLIIKREFRGALIVAGVSSLVILPWIIRNIYYFGLSKFGKGLGIPTIDLSSKLREDTNSVSIIPEFSQFEPLSASEFFNLVILSERWSEFFSFNNLIIILSILSISFIIFFIIIRINSSQSIKNSPIFSNLNGTKLRFYSVLMIFGFFNLLGVYLIVSRNRWPTGLEYNFPFIILLVPFFYFMMELAIHNSKLPKKTIPVIFLSMGIILASIMGFQLFDSAEDMKEKYKMIPNKWIGINSWIKENIDPKSIISSNYPLHTQMATGIQTISTPENILDEGILETFSEKNEIDYIVLYDQDNINPKSFWTPVSLYDIKTHLPISDNKDDGSNENLYVLYYNIDKFMFDSSLVIFKEKYYESTPRFHQIVYELVDLTSVFPYTYEIGVKLKYLDLADDTTKIFYEPFVKQENPELLNILRVMATLFEKEYDERSIIPYMMILANDKNTVAAWEYLISIHHSKKDFDTTLKIYDQYSNFYEEILYDLSINQKAAKKFQDFYITTILEQIKIQKMLEYETKLAPAYNKILVVDRFNEIALLGAAEAYEKQGVYQLAIQYYEIALQFSDDKQPLQQKIDELKDYSTR